MNLLYKITIWLLRKTVLQLALLMLAFGIAAFLCIVAISVGDYWLLFPASCIAAYALLPNYE